MSDQDAPPPVFVDLEASSLLPGSYPVEVGWARPRALPWGRCAIDVGSVLVRPEADWLSSGSWDPNAEAVHGLSRGTLLRDGVPAADRSMICGWRFSTRRRAADLRVGRWRS